MDTIMRRDCSFKNRSTGAKTVLAKGTPVKVFPYYDANGKQRDIYCTIMYGEQNKEIMVRSALIGRYCEGFEEISLNDLEQYMTDSAVCISLTGETVEPDGHDELGFPSVLMAVGLL